MLPGIKDWVIRLDRLPSRLNIIWLVIPKPVINRFSMKSPPSSLPHWDPRNQK